jgi:UDP-glucose 4-epimerase
MAGEYSRALVTGGAGFIGSHIVDRLLKEGCEVTVIDDLSTGKPQNLAHHQGEREFHLIQGDIRNFSSVKDAVKDVDAVFHEAAIVSVPLSVEDPIGTNDVNVVGTLNVLKACLNSDVKRFIYGSSTAIYGDAEKLPIKDDSLPQPTSPYGASKLAAESYANAFYKVYGLETVCLRYFNVYGPRQAYGPYSGVMTIFINRILGGRPLIIYGDGEQTRDFVNAKDIIEANMLALERNNAAGQVFNIATGVATTVNQLAKLLQEVMGKTELKVVHEDPRKGDIRHNYADISKARKILGYSPKVSLRDGLTQLVEWWLKKKERSKEN